MNKKTKYLFILILSLLIICEVTISSLFEYKSLTKEDIENKEIFISAVTLPDISISTEASYIRHRSLANLSGIFADGPEHMEYFPTAFVFSTSGLSDE
ncbi:MAG: hypothetical protein U9Q04_04145 [Campylobacterota bacterium]|nr:hypothetical protein [Campylobacterota bacterium]